MTRKEALAAIKVAAYHENTKEMMRLYIENRISKKAYDEAVEKGRIAKLSGVGCSCYRCSNN